MSKTAFVAFIIMTIALVQSCMTNHTLLRTVKMQERLLNQYIPGGSK